MTNQPDESGLVTPAEGLVTPSGLTSVPAGMETPENIELRKKKIEQEMEEYGFSVYMKVHLFEILLWFSVMRLLYYIMCCQKSALIEWVLQ